MKSRVGQLLSFYFPNTIRLYTVCNNSSVTADDDENKAKAVAPHVTSSAVTEELLQTVYKRIVL
jgi:hypothetical protein